VDDVLNCSARFFAGPAAYRCDTRIQKLEERLRACVEKEKA